MAVEDSVPLRTYLGRLGLVAALMGAVGEIAVVWRWISIGSELAGAEGEYNRAVHRTLAKLGSGAPIREFQGKYGVLRPGPDGNPQLYEITELTKLKKEHEDHVLSLTNERLEYPPIMLGIIIPIFAGAALWIFGKDPPSSAA